MASLRRKTISLVLASALAGLIPATARAELKTGPGRVPFWLGLGSNQQIDPQVIALLADDAAVVVLRARLSDPESGEPLAGPISRLQSAAPSTPVLLYSWASRHLPEGRSGDEIMGWLAGQPELQVHSKTGKPMKSFGDVTRPSYRERTCSANVHALERSSADGMAFDLAMRTPRLIPRPLAQRCAEDGAFCAAYAEGMDRLFEELRSCLGRPILYNGLWNFSAGMVSDQARLFAHADAAIVEYFGMNPREKGHSFTQDILPYLQAMQNLPERKKLFIYGRGPWHYTDYEEDYLWQRYLYGAYLLGSGENTFFKYHASFQVPVNAGRSGGLATYIDWNLALGRAKDEYRNDGGVYSRHFQHGLVLVAPDDGQGGEFTLDQARFTPEGERREGRVRLEPGSALLLLDIPPQNPPAREIALRPLAAWHGARWQQPKSGAAFLVLDAVPAKPVTPPRDILLDRKRSLVPFPTLELRVRPRSKDAALLAVAEVDDPQHRQTHLVVAIPTAENARQPAAGPLPRFRLPVREESDRKVPYVYGQHLRQGQWQRVVLDPADLDLGLYKFRRWSHVRLQGSFEVQTIVLRRK